ncbi:MAG: HAMP domain-containing sensor histidine kinase [Bacteroidales bacterium]|nr:HAMP domain-containing sensor histidine kinase [Bacteroidales bacterium]
MLLLLAGFMLFPALLSAKTTLEKGTVLVIASYNPDTKRMSNFISSFEKEIVQRKYPYEILIEDMGCKGISEAYLWRGKMAEVLQKYNRTNLKAIILLGQEAWASFLAQDKVPENIPFFACFASRNGIILPASDSVDLINWEPESIDMEEIAAVKGTGGGYVNIYDVPKNIELIRSFYPKVEHIAFLSDNTYGGISLQSMVKKEMKAFPELDLILIDGRKHTPQKAVKIISDLPPNTVLLIGTWRVNKDGLYFLNSSMETLIAGRPDLPVFSLSGIGIGNLAIGGYVPKYSNNITGIADQIASYYQGNPDSVYFSNGSNEYQFDKKKLQKLEVKEYQLPANSVIVNKLDEKLREYELYIYTGSAALVLLSLFIIFLCFMYYHNKRLRNILEQREGELIEAKEKAEESNRLKTAFLANMSHEIRTPLNAIVGFSSLICDPDVSEEEQTEFQKIISKNSDMLLTLINDILDISRLETGKTPFVYKQEDIVGLCKQIMSTITHKKKENIEYVFNPPCESYILETDAQRLSQILINLLTNATKFTDTGSITLTFEVQEDQNRVLFSVTDTGCGIPKEKQDKVFDRFEKLNEYKQGTGLGLSICRQIAHIFNGNIWLDGEYTSGCRFVFAHPIKKEKK